MIEMTIGTLFDITDLYFSELFRKAIYPWELFSKIDDYINSFNNSNFSEIDKGIFVGKGVVISKNAVIEAPTIIGDNTVIRPSAYIRGSVIIGAGCVIGNSTEIKKSILMNCVQVPHYNYVGDSILGNHSHMGAGAICSNLKSNGTNVVIHAINEIHTDLRKLGAILGDNVDVGCNCVLNPGTVIGKNSTVYPLSSVRGVIPDNSIYKSKDCVIKKIKPKGISI